jgi:hypothetical protein
MVDPQFWDLAINASQDKSQRPSVLDVARNSMADRVISEAAILTLLAHFKQHSRGEKGAMV